MNFLASCQTFLHPKCKSWSDNAVDVFVFYSTVPFQMFQVILLIMSLAKAPSSLCGGRGVSAL